MPKKTVVAVPKDLEDAAKFIAEIAAAQREIDRIQDERNAMLDEIIDQLTLGAMIKKGPHINRINELVEGLSAYAETHRDELTNGGKRKTVELPTGNLEWRTTPPDVSLTNVAEIIVSLKALGLARFIRVKEEVDKDAMLKEPHFARTVKGVSISQREEFFVKPSELEIEFRAKASRLKSETKNV